MNMRRSHGMSLVELLVAIALGAVLLGGATTLFVNNRATYNITNDMARMQENARFALETMVKDLRMAGYVGCFAGARTNEVKNRTGSGPGVLWDLTFPLEGYDPDQPGALGDTWQPSGNDGTAPADTDLDVSQFGIPADLERVGDPAIPSDAITMRYLDGHRNDDDGNGTPDLQLTNSVYSGDLDLVLDNVDFAAVGWRDGQPAALSDCGSVDVFLITNDPTADGFVQAGDLSRAFDPVNLALFAPAVGVRYFVRVNPDNVPSLYRGSIDNVFPVVERADELVDGVDTLQVLYGLDTDGDDIIENFAPASAMAAADWGAVIAVRFALLMRTVDEYGPATNPENRFQVADQVFCTAALAGDAACDQFLPDDRRSRRVYQTTVRVRNF